MKEETKTALKDYLTGLLNLLGESAEMQIKHETDREISINLQGLQSIDGTDPKPLRSLSYLAEISMRRKTGKGIKVFLDANGRQEGRIRDLKNLASSSAEHALRERARVELPPMETQDRKLIHEHLSTFDGVKTHSEGQGENRRVIIEPLSDKSQEQRTQQRSQEHGESEETAIEDHSN